MRLIQQLESYQPFNAQEEADRREIQAFVQTHSDAFLRSNRIAHMTASAWVTNAQRNRILMAYHNLYNSWSWLGGHADGETDLLAVAMREVREESGVSAVTPITDALFSVETLVVEGHEKRGRYVPCHLHMNVTYLLQADDGEALLSKPDENSAVKWFTPEEAVAASTEPWFRERIYAKLNQKLALIVGDHSA